jgi:hypothetical protein
MEYYVQGRGVSIDSVQERKGIVTGYIRPVHIQLKSDRQKSFDYAKAYNEEVDKMGTILRKKYATTLPEDIENTAITEEWWRGCPQSK